MTFGNRRLRTLSVLTVIWAALLFGCQDGDRSSGVGETTSALHTGERAGGFDFGMASVSWLEGSARVYEAYIVADDGSLFATASGDGQHWTTCQILSRAGYPGPPIKGKLAAVEWPEGQGASKIWRRNIFGMDDTGGLATPFRDATSWQYATTRPTRPSGVRIVGPPTAVRWTASQGTVNLGTTQILVVVNTTNGFMKWYWNGFAWLWSALLAPPNSWGATDFGSPVSIYLRRGADNIVRVFVTATTTNHPTGELLEFRGTNMEALGPSTGQRQEWYRHGMGANASEPGDLAVTRWIEPGQGPIVAVAVPGTGGARPHFQIAEGGDLAAPLQWKDGGEFLPNDSSPIALSTVWGGTDAERQSFVAAMAIGTDSRLYHFIRMSDGSWHQALEPLQDPPGQPVVFQGGVGTAGAGGGNWFALGRAGVVAEFFSHGPGSRFNRHPVAGPPCP